MHHRPAVEKLTELWLVSVLLVAIGVTLSVFVTLAFVKGLDPFYAFLSLLLGGGYAVSGAASLAVGYYLKALLLSFVGSSFGASLGHLTVAGLCATVLFGMVAALLDPSGLSHDFAVTVSEPVRIAFRVAALWLLAGLVLSSLGGGGGMFRQDASP